MEMNLLCGYCLDPVEYVQNDIQSDNWLKSRIRKKKKNEKVLPTNGEFYWNLRLTKIYYIYGIRFLKFIPRPDVRNKLTILKKGLIKVIN